MHDDVVRKLWSLSNVLRDDGMVFHQYMTELTYLLFLKISSETGAEASLPDGCRWADLTACAPSELLGFYRKMLTALGEDSSSEMVRKIFAFPTTVFQHSENLRLVVVEIDRIQWYDAGRDGFGDIYEGLLEKNTIESKSGAGQYFTPRPLIDSIVDLVKPKPSEIVQDPAAGTGGFLVAADRHAKRLHNGAPGPKCEGLEIVKDTHRLCLMNMFVHNVNADIYHGDALSDDCSFLSRPDVIITNPPFGTKGGSAAPRRKDLPFETSNKQLLFLQHIYRALKPGGRAAVVVPDNVLFETRATEIRRDLMKLCNLHTILRLPSGIFYSPGVQTNVLFFTKNKKGEKGTAETWIYDLRSGQPQFNKNRPFTRKLLTPFELAYVGERQETDVFRKFSRAQIAEAGDSLDLGVNDPNTPMDCNSDPEMLAAEIVDLLRSAAEEMAAFCEHWPAEPKLGNQK